jgi:hypothetical protein
LRGGGGAPACGAETEGDDKGEDHGGDTGLNAEPKEEAAMGDEGGGKGLRRWQARRWGAEYARCGMGWGGMGRKKDSPTTRPIGANLDNVSDGWLCVETTLAATVTASQPTRAVQHIKLLRVARFGCCAR